VAARIVAAAELDTRPAVLEIGPGRGALTTRLRGATDRLYLVEIDPALADGLRRQYGDDPGVVIRCGDVLDIDLPALVAEPRVHVVGNLPYSVASQILLRLIELRDRCPVAVTMLQEEMATRVAAAPGGRTYGVLGVLVQLWAEVEWCFRVSRRCFAPPPQVESAVVRLRFHRDPRVSVGDSALFTALVRSLFQHRRKMVRGTLGDALDGVGVDRRMATELLRETGIDPRARPEVLGLEELGRLSVAVHARR
jgi:16S rRNA (adenine1518-N6/adenine1519-N6)-dimethyltransferase